MRKLAQSWNWIEL